MPYSRLTLGFNFLLILLVSGNGFAATHLHKEKTYQEKWCRQAGGLTEVTQANRTRIDCLTELFAIEFEFGSKWEEAIGQSLYYSMQTGKQSGIVLILEKEKDWRYWIRLNSVIDHFDLKIKTWQMRPEDL